MAELVDGQYELSYLGRSVVFGRNTPVKVRTFQVGSAEQANNDYNSPRSDGIGFGRDYRGGRTLNWEGDITTRTTRAERSSGVTSQRKALEALGEIETMWDAEEIRLNPELVAVMRWNRAGSQRRVYGRPRRFDPTPGSTYQGWVPWGADFVARDQNYYDDAEKSISVGMIPAGVGGLKGPRIGPWQASPLGTGREMLVIGGTKPAWMAFRIYGPNVGSIIDPVVEIANQWSFQIRGSIRYDESVMVDSTPWSRGIRRSDGANWSGRLTTLSQRPSAMRLSPGTHQVILRGTDSSQTARVEVFWRDAFGSYA